MEKLSSSQVTEIRRRRGGPILFKRPGSVLSNAALVETGPVTFSSSNLNRSKGTPFFLASHPKYCYSAHTQYKKSWRYFTFIVGASSLKCVFYGHCTSELRPATFTGGYHAGQHGSRAEHATCDVRSWERGQTEGGYQEYSALEILVSVKCVFWVSDAAII